MARRVFRGISNRMSIQFDIPGVGAEAELAVGMRRKAPIASGASGRKDTIHG